RHRRVLVLLKQRLPDRGRLLRERRALALLDGRGRREDEPAVLRGVHLRNRVRLQRERELVERGHRLALRERRQAALVLRGGILRVLLRERAPAPAGQELLEKRSCERALLLADEDVTHGPRRGRLVLAQVLAVVLGDVELGDGDVLRHRVEELLADQLLPDVLAHLRIRQPLLLQLRRVLLLVTAEVLLLQLREPRVHVLGGDGDAELRSLVLLLRLLDEQRDGLALDVRVGARPRLRERLALRLQIHLRLTE